MDTGCEPTSVRFVGLLKKASLVVELVCRFLCTTMSRFLEGLFEPYLISKHLISFEEWGGRSQEVVTVVCSKLTTSQGWDSWMQSASVL